MNYLEVSLNRVFICTEVNIWNGIAFAISQVKII